nr:flavin reductase family protein [Coralloluteibacterium stylophorae]
MPHNPFKAIVAPRPIGWISTVSADGVPNLAPYSFFNALSDTPPIVGFSSSGWKDSVRNAEATGEFVYNVATAELAARMNATAAPLPPDVDEFVEAGLAAAPSRLVRAPRVADSPASLECRLTQIVRMAAADGRETDSWLVLGEVVAVHIDRRHLVDGIYQTAAARPILRAGGRADYAEIGPDSMFRLVRPTQA